MSKNIKINTGETNVKTEDAMSVMNVNMINMTEAGMTRVGEGQWDDFELLGGSDQAEGKYDTVIDEDVSTEALKQRVQNSYIGKRILTLSSLDWRKA